MTQPEHPDRSFSRRRLLQASMLAVPATGLLAACARDNGSGGGSSGGSSASATTLQIASPSNPVTWPINPGNEPIAAGQQPESGATLQVYNYPDYLDPETIKLFEAKYNCKVAVSTFNDTNEALAKIRAGGTPYDVSFLGYDLIGKLVLANLIRPLQHSYIENISNVFAEFTNPWYDQKWQYSVPYVLYTTGIGWRADRVTEDIGARPNPYDVFWDPQYREKMSILDDYREGIGMTLLRNGVTDVNTGDDAQLKAASEAMTLMTKTTKPKVTITDYTDLPEGRTSIAQAWSGDMVSALNYMPKGMTSDVFRYWFPADGKGMVNNDLMLVLKGGQNPVLAHLFLNFMLQPDIAVKNYKFTGYQPPQVSLTPEAVVASGIVPPNLKSVVVQPSYFNSGYRLLELPPDIEAKWQSIWQQFKAGG